MDNIPGELLDETARHHAHANPSALADLLRVVAGHHVVRADKLRSLRTRGWKGASDELDTVARHITEYADALAAHAELYPVGTTFTPSPEPHPDAVPELPGNTGRCAAFRRADPDDQAVCVLERGHDGDHAGSADGHPDFTWPRRHSGHVCGDVVVIYDGTAINCALPLGHGGDEHHDGRYHLWPRGVGTSRNVRVCERCNTDTHRCPGCGEPVGHFAQVCDACKAEQAREAEEGVGGGTALFDAAEPGPLDYDGMCADALQPTAQNPTPDVCMLPTGHTGIHIGKTGQRWAHTYGPAAPSTLAEQADAMRAALAPSIPAPREPMAEFVEAAKAAIASTPAAVLVAETREEVAATVAELTGDEPIGTTVNVGGIEFVKHSDNPFPPTVNDGSPLGNALSNPFAGQFGTFTHGRQTEHGPMEPPSINGVPLSNPFAPPPAPKALLLPPHLVPGSPKPHQSVSSIQTMSECGLRYRLQYRDGLSQRRPAWWNVGGTSFHSTVQHIERVHAESGGSLYPLTEPVFQTERDAAGLWGELFDQQVATTEAGTLTDASTWQAAKGGKENGTWWKTAGEDMVRRYVHHRREFLRSWRLLTTPSGGLAQEVEFNAVIQGVPMRGFIDSAWISLDGTVIRVEDYKSGASSGDPFQLKTYGAALRAMGADTTEQGTRRIVGTFYEARKGASSDALALTTADDAEVSYRANTTAMMDRAGIFPANPGSNCKTCDVAASCPIMAMKS